MRSTLRIERLERRLTPSSSVSLISRADPTLPSDSAGGVSDFTGGRNQLISNDGRYTVFTSTAANLVTGQIDANNTTDIFVHDRLLNTNTLVSHAASSSLTTADQKSLNPTISGDGRFVLYESNAQNLVAGFADQNNDFLPRTDLFQFDRVLLTTTLVSHSTAGPDIGSSGMCSLTYLSGQGNAVAFASTGKDLIAGYTDPPGNSSNQAYLFDRVTGVMTLMSHSPTSPTMGGSFRLVAGITDDGNRVLLRGSQVNVWNRLTDTLTLISHKFGSTTTTGNMGAGSIAMSADGNIVLFSSSATDLIPGYVSGHAGSDLFVANVATGIIALVNHAAGSMTTGADAGPISSLTLAADGSAIVYLSKATNLVDGFVAGAANVAQSVSKKPDFMIGGPSDGSWRRG